LIPCSTCFPTDTRQDCEGKSSSKATCSQFEELRITRQATTAGYKAGNLQCKQSFEVRNSSQRSQFVTCGGDRKEDGAIKSTRFEPIIWLNKFRISTWLTCK
uniref:Sushi domain-containing protein n=1 Tax=Ascaris lumbricoides TaxID=6252 RepID=A0A0M3I6W8_ASCLU